MSALGEIELAREARRLLRRLLGGARLERGDDGRYAIVAGGRKTHHAKIAAPLADAMCAKGWLAPQRGDFSVLILSDAGKGWYVRASQPLDPFAAQHQLRRARTIVDEQGSERTVVVNAAESPLTWMHQRGIVSDVQCQAGERLRRDYTMAQLSPRLGVDFSAPVVFGRRAARPDSGLPDMVLAAKQRFTRAMRAAGPGLSDILFDVCCHLNGLEESERARGWPRASAKVVLKIALDRLAAHYGMTCRRAPSRVRAWAMEDEGASLVPSPRDSSQG